MTEKDSVAGKLKVKACNEFYVIVPTGGCFDDLSNQTQSLLSMGHGYKSDSDGSKHRTVLRHLQRDQQSLFERDWK